MGVKTFENHCWASIDVEDEVYLSYAGRDAIYVRRLLPILVRMCEPFLDLVRIETWLAAQGNRITLKGMRVDGQYIHETLAELETEAQGHGQFIKDTCGARAPESPRRIAWLLEQGVEFRFFTDTNQPSLSKDKGLPDLLTRYRDHDVIYPVLEAINKYNATKNVRNTLRALQTAMVNGRVHPILHTNSARTSRMSVTSPAVQTLKKDDPRLRGCLLAEEGHVLISCDFSAVEARIVAALAGEEAMLRVFAESGDVHPDEQAGLGGHLHGVSCRQSTPSHRLCQLGVDSPEPG